MKINDNGVERDATPEEEAEILAIQAGPNPWGVSVKTYKADIWRRSTDDEAAVIDASINAQPLRMRNLFRDAAYLAHDDPSFAELRAGFVAAFSEARADELLAPSE